MSFNIISVKQFRENFGGVKALLEEGKEVLLIYRSKPLAKIQPIKKREVLPQNKKLRLIDDLSGGIRLKSWTPQKLSKIIDKSYGKVLSR